MKRVQLCVRCFAKKKVCTESEIKCVLAVMGKDKDKWGLVTEKGWVTEQVRVCLKSWFEPDPSSHSSLREEMLVLFPLFVSLSEILTLLHTAQDPCHTHIHTLHAKLLPGDLSPHRQEPSRCKSNAFCLSVSPHSVLLCLCVCVLQFNSVKSSVLLLEWKIREHLYS